MAEVENRSAGAASDPAPASSGGAPADAAQPVILFDGVCNLCHGWVRFVLRRDRGAVFRFAPLQSAAARELLTRHGLPADTLDSVVYIKDGRVYGESTAALEILGELGGVWWCCSGLRVVPRPLRDWVYGVIARNRYRWFGKRDTCAPPPAEWRARFLDTGA